MIATEKIQHQLFAETPSQLDKTALFCNDIIGNHYRSITFFIFREQHR